VIFLNQIGTTDQLEPIDTALWVHCMLHQSSVPPLCPTTFQDYGEAALFATLGLTLKDITHTNCRNIYITLVHSISVLVSEGSFRMPLSV
jgi:hypothetical protein